MALRLYMDERTYAKIERGVNKSMDIRLLSAIADILDTDVTSLLADPNTHTTTTTQEKAGESPESEKNLSKNNVTDPVNETLLQEIMALKAEVKELIAVQKKAMKLLKL
jgi:transcriptional regulator with XRE-family HTH domain